MFSHRGACLDALGEMMELRLHSRSVHLWAPMKPSRIR